MNARWQCLSLVLLLLAPSCIRYGVAKFAVGHYAFLDEVPSDSSVVLIDPEGWSEEVTHSKGARYQTGEALAANLKAALLATFARVRLAYGTGVVGGPEEHVLEVNLAGTDLVETGLISNLELTLRLEAVLRDADGSEVLRRTYTASCRGAGDPRAALRHVLDSTIVQVTRSLLEDVRAALGRSAASQRDGAPAPAARHERLLVLAPVCDGGGDRLSRVLHGVLIREAAERSRAEVVPEVEVERALRSAEGQALVGCAERGCAVHAAGLVDATSVVFGSLSCSASAAPQPIRFQRLDAVAGAVEREHEGTLAPTQGATAHEANLLAATLAAAAALFDESANDPATVGDTDVGSGPIPAPTDGAIPSP